jgi:hypothetical protein
MLPNTRWRWGDRETKLDELSPNSGNHHACTIGLTLPRVSVPSDRSLVGFRLVRRLMGVNRHDELQCGCPRLRGSASG